MSKKKPPAPAPSTALVLLQPAQLDALPSGAIDVEFVEAKVVDPLAEYLKTLSSENSKRTMRVRLNVAAAMLRLGATAETFPWATLTRANVLQVMDALRQVRPELSSATINLTRAAFRGMARTLFNIVIDDRRLMTADERMAIDDVRVEPGSRTPKRASLDDKEIRKLFKAAVRKTPATAAARDSALLAVLFGAGLRRDEASRLDVDNFRNGKLHVRGKGKRYRDADIGPDASRAVEQWLKVRGDGKSSDGKQALFLTINKAGRIGTARLSGDAIFYKVDALAARASLGSVSPHALRRAFVTALLNMGEDLGTASKAAGHGSITTTSLYDQRDATKVAAAVGRLHVPFGA